MGFTVLAYMIVLSSPTISVSCWRRYSVQEDDYFSIANLVFEACRVLRSHQSSIHVRRPEAEFWYRWRDPVAAATWQMNLPARSKARGISKDSFFDLVLPELLPESGTHMGWGSSPLQVAWPRKSLNGISQEACLLVGSRSRQVDKCV